MGLKAEISRQALPLPGQDAGIRSSCDPWVKMLLVSIAFSLKPTHLSPARVTSLFNISRIAIVVAAMLAALGIAWPLMPNGRGQLGYDYNYFLPYLLAGEQWIRANGWLSPPYFTPAFCGGMPWLAIPQSMVWSLPQILFDALGALGTWLLLRRAFRTSADAATLGAVLFAVNGFLVYRIAIGHLTYQVFGLVPLLAVLALWDGGRDAVGIACRMAAVALLLAAMVFAGALNFVMPMVLSTAAIILARQTRDGLRLVPWLVLAGGCVWSIPISAIKLVPAAIFVPHYPRNYLDSGLFSTIPGMLGYALRIFAIPGTLPDTIALGAGRLVLGLHEFEFGVTIVPFILLVAAIVAVTWRKPRHPYVWAGLFIILLFPFGLSAGGQGWERLLADLPIINNNSVMTRWWAIDILPAIVAGALSLDRVFQKTVWRHAALAAGAAVAIAQSAAHPAAYYANGSVFPPYQPQGIARAHAALAAGGSLPAIGTVGPALAPADGANASMDGLLRGVSSLPCYEPVFGYNLEWLPKNALRSGSIASGGDAARNLADPRCYLDAGDRGCRPGAALRADDTAATAAFTRYRPMPWKAPLWQRVASGATAIALAASFLMMCIAAARLLYRVGILPRTKP